MVAQRLKTLGALTKGDRRAAGGGDTSADGIDSFAIEGAHGRDAIEMMGSALIAFRDGKIPPNAVRDFATLYSIVLVHFAPEGSTFSTQQGETNSVKSIQLLSRN